MSTTETVQAWATTNAGNTSSDAAISSSDSQSPGTLDDNIRSIMTAVKKYAKDIGGALTAGGSANALTVTTNQVLESGQLTGGLGIVVKAASTNTSTSVTFAPDGLTAAAIKRTDGSALAVGSIQAGMFLLLIYNSGTSEWWTANIPPLVSGGLVYLASGTWSSQATGDIVLTSYTGFRGIKIVLSGVLPVTDGANLTMRFSTDGGSNYDTSGYNYVVNILNDSGISAPQTSGSAGVILLAEFVGSGPTKGGNFEITLLNQTSTAFWSRAMFNGYWIDNSASPGGNYGTGGGSREAAQDTDAVRFLFSSGNIAAGNYAVYGLV
jgi:hypothetical protein